jgi:hypothetical protein
VPARDPLRRDRAARLQDRGDRGTYRLYAHVAGDPPSKLYCLDAYQSGQIAEAGALTTECWRGAGVALGSFQRVDRLGLGLPSAETPQAFDYCITGIAVDGTASRARDPSAARHITIGGHGKLGGDMTGYAWVAGDAATTLSSPATCDRDGCFRNEPGRLCVEGTIAPLRCGGQREGTACDPAVRWGAVIGMDANLARGPWGPDAPSAVGIAFTGPPGNYRMIAHVAGDPDDRSYCVDRYRPGIAVDAPAFKTRCGRDGGEALTSFQQVDRIGLQIVAAERPTPIDVCVTDLLVR